MGKVYRRGGKKVNGTGDVVTAPDRQTSTVRDKMQGKWKLMMDTHGEDIHI